MLRKAKITSLLTFFVTTPCFSGFYAGATVGPEGAIFSQKSHIILLQGPDTIEDKEHFAGTGVFGSIFAGFDRDYNRFNLAAEVNVNISSLQYLLVNDEALHHTFSKTTFRVTNSEGVSLLPGYYLSETTLFYGRVGYVNGRLKITESDPSINSITKNRSGIRYGVGVRHAVTPQFSVLMDYSQITYQNVKSFYFDPIGQVSKSTKITPNTAQIGFGFMYSFDKPKAVFVK